MPKPHCFWIVLVGLVLAQVGPMTRAEDYRLPPSSVVDIIDAPLTPQVSFSPDGNWMLFVEFDAMPSIADLSRRMLRLAGDRIDPSANALFQSQFIRGVSLRRTNDSESEPIPVPVPDGCRLSRVSWSHDSQHFALIGVTERGSELWMGNVDRPRRPTHATDRLSLILTGLSWMPDGKSLLCALVPDSRADEPPQPTVPVGPNVEETDGQTSPSRTFQDLLKNPYDEALFSHFATCQLAIVSDSGSIQRIGSPAMFRSHRSSPNGEFLLVSIIDRPFSYLLTAGSFPHRIEVWNRQGEVVYTVADVPMAENIPIQGVRTGRRNVRWMASRPATLMWCEALDGGDPNLDVDHRDRWETMAAPFDESPREIVQVEHRAVGVLPLKDPDLLITYEYDRDRRWIRSLLHDLKTQDSPQVLMDRSIRDRYADPGSPMTEPNESGFDVVQQQGDWLFLAGRGATPEGNRPFLDRLNLQTLESQRLWQCGEDELSSVVELYGQTDDRPMRWVTSRQSPEEPANYFLHSEAAAAKALTAFADPTPQIRGIKKELVTYERSDGVPLSATLYLPADYQPGTRLPLLLWAYPVEFNDAATAGQIGTSPNRFTTIRGASHLALVTQGYAVLDGATMPIIGDPETMNDTFIEQLVDAAQSAIDFAVERGVADRHRVAVGGHSYGAFMVANLLAHCDLFQAGIARSGAYNRTLTPFGFQSERRPLWEARDVYESISPFMYADSIQSPLLLIHGEQDNNSGTFPMQSKRMFQAIRGNGGTARLVMLPKESHGYRARESVLHVQAEMLAWLNTHLTTDPAASDAPSEADAGPSSPIDE